MFTEVTTHLHPIIVHFPIALIVIALCYELVIVIKHRSLLPIQGLWIWFIAALSSWISVATGPEDAARGNTDFLEIHSTLADLTAWVVTLLVAWRIFMIWSGRRPFVKATLVIYLCVSIISCGLVLGTGYYGGKMVYTDGVGVKSNGVEVNPPVHRNRH